MFGKSGFAAAVTTIQFTSVASAGFGAGGARGGGAGFQIGEAGGQIRLQFRDRGDTPFKEARESRRARRRPAADCRVRASRRRDRYARRQRRREAIGVFLRCRRG